MVNSTAAPESTPHSTERGEKKADNSQDKFEQGMYQRSLFMAMALNMTWQLALVVIVPIVGGYALDQHYHRSPWLTLGGLVVAAIGVFGVLHKVVSEATQRSGYGKPKGTA